MKVSDILALLESDMVLIEVYDSNEPDELIEGDTAFKIQRKYGEYPIDCFGPAYGGLRLYLAMQQE